MQYLVMSKEGFELYRGPNADLAANVAQTGSQTNFITKYGVNWDGNEGVLETMTYQGGEVLSSNQVSLDARLLDFLTEMTEASV